MTTPTSNPSATHPLASAVLISWKRNGAYALRLVGDLGPTQWTAQPIPGRTLNHPAWVLAHLNLYAHVAARMCAGEPFDDPAEHRYGAKSEVLADPAAYPDPGTLVSEFARLHDAAAGSLAVAGEGLLMAPNPLARWRTLHPRTGDMLVTLMVKHESGHLGQLSAWRRGMGLPRVAV